MVLVLRALRLADAVEDVGDTHIDVSDCDVPKELSVSGQCQLETLKVWMTYANLRLCRGRTACFRFYESSDPNQGPCHQHMFAARRRREQHLRCDLRDEVPELVRSQHAHPITAQARQPFRSSRPIDRNSSMYVEKQVWSGD